MGKILSPELFSSTDTVAHARSLIGQMLVVRGTDGSIEKRAILETEAYDGFEDKASHASRGKTARNAPMFGSAGHWYVYLCYGIHELLNLVTGPEGYPAAVLIRGVSGAIGPGRVTRSLGIDRRFNALAASKATGLWLEAGDASVVPTQLQEGPRVGVDYAGLEWASKPWRFRHPEALTVGARVRFSVSQ